MPYVSITTAKKIDSAAKEKLNKEICDIMPILPGKDKDNTLLCIIDGTAMYKSGAPNDGVFIEVRLFKKSPEDAKKEFAQKIHALLKDVLKLEDSSCTYMNYIEFDNWAANGNYN
jgi:phenylpyruvate tautomerase PptA (4-oxalocrotonate tautomerase family)